jgi:hypothetical protein
MGGIIYHINNNIDEISDLSTKSFLGYKITARDNSDYKSIGIFIGRDSINSPIIGAIASSGKIYHDFIYLGFAIGGYKYKLDNWRERYIMPADPMRIEHVILMGTELNFKFDFDQYYFTLNNILTPILTNHTVSIGVNF